MSKEAKRIIQNNKQRKENFERKATDINDLCKVVLETAKTAHMAVAEVVRGGLYFEGIGDLAEQKQIVMYFNPEYDMKVVTEIGKVVHSATQKEVLMIPRGIQLGQIDDDMMKSQGWVRDPDYKKPTGEQNFETSAKETQHDQA